MSGDQNYFLRDIRPSVFGVTQIPSHYRTAVARLYNPATGEKEWGNKFVTSCLEIGDIYVPYRAQMYIPGFDRGCIPAYP